MAAADEKKDPNAMELDEPAPKDAPKDAKKDKDAKGAKKDKKVEELSEEDLQLKAELELLVERLSEPQVELHRLALETLRTLIRTSTSSMTSVPKPLKFLRPKYSALIESYEKMAAGENKAFLADILSVLAMTYSEEGKRDCLKYRLLGSSEPISSWGHEYVKHLAMEIGQEFQFRSESEQPSDELMKMALDIVPFFMAHNAEADACDLLLEMEALDKIPSFVDKNSYPRVCLYLVSCVNYVPYPEDIQILKTVHQIYRQMDRFPEALVIAMRLNDMDIISADFNECTDPILKKQLAFILARQHIRIESDNEELTSILNNAHLSEQFINLARELDVLEPKVPEDIYKSHLENNKSTTVQIDSARQNLAATFVNAFVNVGFGKDKLMTVEGNPWLYKNKEHGMLSASASVGLIHLWDVDSGLTQIDKFLYSNEDNVKAGALLAIGIVNSGTKNECDPALGLLSEYLQNPVAALRIGAINGLGFAYAGSRREDVLELLLPLVSDTGLSIEISSMAALALGLIFIGSAHADITSTILQTMMERDEKSFQESVARFLGLGLALLYLGKQEAADATLETLKVIEYPVVKVVSVLVEICAYAGTGNVLRIQNMLHICNDHLDEKKEYSAHQAIAVIGIALIAMGEEIGTEMALRTLNHLMHYGEIGIRRAVPLALGLLCASHPMVQVLDTLSKYSHDHDAEVALNSIFAMGLVGAGTNNARLAQMLRQLAVYYHKDPNSLFIVRIAQGLIHMGKGTVSINPFHSNRSLLSPVAVGGILTTLLAFTDVSKFILGKDHYFLYYLVNAIYPRFLITMDENLKPLSATVRVGQAVDVVGQAGRPKTITGFQTHSTPVLLGHTERAELATEEYLTLSSTLEGFVILKKNPEYVEVETDKKKK